MSLSYKLFFAGLLLMVSCQEKTSPDNNAQGTPEALQEEGSSSYSIASKRGYGDLVQSLYAELAEKTPELKALEEKIQALSGSKDDSLSAFAGFDAKNRTYFTSANSHAGQIKDSVLREKTTALITAALSKYTALSSRHDSVVNYINQQETSLSDLHQVLKIVRTLPLIEQYQKSNLPPTKSLEGFAGEVTQTRRTADSLVRKTNR